MGRSSLGAALTERGRPNSLNLVRLVLAGLVLVAHSWPLGGFGDDPRIGGASMGTWAVGGFFAISGFLISGSRARLPVGPYLRARALRILPAFWVCLVLTAFVAAPMVSLATSDSWQPGSSVGYVVRNLALWDGQGTIGDTLTGVPFPLAWNGSLWTLKFEAAAYLVLCVLLVGGTVRRAWWPGLATVLFLGSVAAAAYSVGHVSTSLVLDGVALSTYFTAGMLLYAWRERVPVSVPLAVGALVLVTVGVVVGQTELLAPLGWAYLVLYAGATVPARWAQRHDISYGVYIYAFPVQQVLAVAGIQSAGLVVYAVTAAACVSVLAWGSWLLVERPALRLKPRGALRGSPAGEAALGGRDPAVPSPGPRS